MRKKVLQPGGVDWLGVKGGWFSTVEVFAAIRGKFMDFGASSRHGR